MSILSKILFLFSFLYLNLSSVEATIAQSPYSLYEVNGKWGLLDGAGEVLISAAYENLGWSDGTHHPIEGVIGYEQNGLWGLISISNRVLSKALYSQLYFSSDQFLVASRSPSYSDRELFGILNPRGQAVVGFQYSSIKSFNSGFLVGQKFDGNELFGVISLTEEKLVPIIYQNIVETVSNYIVKKQGTGILNRSGKELTSLDFDDITILTAKYLKTQKQGKFGLIRTDGSEMLPNIYKSIEAINDSMVKATHFPQWEMMLPNSGKIKSFHYDEITAVNVGVFETKANDFELLINTDEELIVNGGNWRINALDNQFVLVEKDGKNGIIKEGGIEVVPINFDSIYYAGKHFYCYLNEANKSGWRIISTYGTPLNSALFEELYPMSEGLIAVKKNGYWGYLDFSGKEVISFKYDLAFPFVDSRAEVNYLGNEGIINTVGNWIVHAEYDHLEVINKNLFMSKSGDRIDLIGPDGKVLYQTYNDVERFDYGLLETTSSGKKGLIGPFGSSLLPPVFDFISNIQNDQLLVVNKGDQWGVIDTDGRYVLPLTDEFQFIGGLSEAFLTIKKDNRFGFIDLEGRLRIANRYDSVRSFHDGMAAVKLLGKWGFIDRLEKLRIQPQFNEISEFSDRLAIVSKDGFQGLIDPNGTEVLPISYDEIHRNEDGSFVIKKDDFYGLANNEGLLVIHPKYEYLQEHPDGFVIVKLRGKFGVLKANGVNAIPSIYDHIFYDGINGYYFGKQPPEIEILSIK